MSKIFNFKLYNYFSGPASTILSRSELKPKKELINGNCPCQLEDKCHWAIALNKFNPETEAAKELKKKIINLKSFAR